MSYRERALSLERYAANCRLGAEGEAALDSVLERLIDRGWHPLPDRRSRKGGNIDELFVGPAGVAVLDAKNWSYPLTIRGDRLRTGKFPKDRELEHVVQLVDEVKDVLRRSSLGPVAVQGFMTLCAEVEMITSVVERGFPPILRSTSGPSRSDVG
ncbi:MAG TPA: nuclease-related domain-containing protein [Acidimicrobiales bacterium]|nr:nuclease-related domain-containing protein [Acidimicrobiales bacterium]